MAISNQNRRDLAEIDLLIRIDAFNFNPGGHLKWLQHEQWQGYESNNSSGPAAGYVWEISPLGQAIEVIAGSAEHALCRSEGPEFMQIISQSRCEIAAEALFMAGQKFEFVDFLEANPTALSHILQIEPYLRRWYLERAQKIATAVKAHQIKRELFNELLKIN